MSDVALESVRERYRIETIAVFKKRSSDKGNVLARIQFAYTHRGFDPLKVGREYKDDEAQEWKFFEIVSVPQGSRVAIRDCKLIDGPNGVFIAGPFKNLPQDVCGFVAGEAKKVVNLRSARDG